MLTEGDRAVGVEYEGPDGPATLKSDYVVNCAGLWARQLGEKSGVLVPNQAAEHYYLLTEAMDDVDPTWPVVEDPSNYTYIRPEGGGLLVGLFEGEAAPWAVDRAPEDFAFGEIDPDWDRVGPYLELATSRVRGPASFRPSRKEIPAGPRPRLSRKESSRGVPVPLGKRFSRRPRKRFPRRPVPLGKTNARRCPRRRARA